jgi:diketogulonate reductase-like aldo/keto reductase
MRKYAYISPMVNQVEFHPFLYQKELLEYCKNNGIILEAHTPLVGGNKMNHPIIVELAKKYNKSESTAYVLY